MAGGKPSSSQDGGRPQIEASDTTGLGLLVDITNRLRGKQGAEYTRVLSAILNMPLLELINLLKKEGKLLS